MSLGFAQSHVDPTLFVKQTDRVFRAFLVYVDEILLVSNMDAAIVDLKQLLARDFKIKDLGTMRYFFGFRGC